MWQMWQNYDYDKRKENKACEGAIGFVTGKDIKILNIYREFADLLNNLGDELGLKIHVTHEDLFNSMHRI